MGYIIVIRMSNGTLKAIMNSEDDMDHVHVFVNMDEALECAESHPLCNAMPFQIVELEI